MVGSKIALKKLPTLKLKPNTVELPNATHKVFEFSTTGIGTHLTRTTSIDGAEI